MVRILRHFSSPPTCCWGLWMITWVPGSDIQLAVGGKSCQGITAGSGQLRRPTSKKHRYERDDWVSAWSSPTDHMLKLQQSRSALVSSSHWTTNCSNSDKRMALRSAEGFRVPNSVALEQGGRRKRVKEHRSANSIAFRGRTSLTVNNPTSRNARLQIHGVIPAACMV